MTTVIELEAVCAPERLAPDTRIAFRDAVLRAQAAALQSGSTVVSVDLTHMEDVDASGLGTLVVLQKRGREKGLTMRLVGTQPQIRRLLANTRLEALFDFA